MIEDKKVLLVKVDTLKNTADALTKSMSPGKFSCCRETMGISRLDKWLSSIVAPYGKKTTSGRMLGCVIFFPWLAHIVNWGVRGGGKAPPSLHQLHSGGIIGGLRDAGFVHDFRTCFWTLWFSVHGFGHDGFRSMVLDASTCINMYYKIERNIMKNQASSPSFGIQGKISVYMCFMYYALALFILCVLEFVCR